MEIVEMIKVVGGGGLLFIVFYLYHKTTSAQLTKIIDNNFKILESLINQNTLILSYVQEIKTAVYNNLWCPYIRREARGDKNE